MSRRDDLYRHQTASAGSFRFDERVVEVFPDMIDRSVPGYALLVPMIGQLSKRFVQPQSVVHDLGCSLGAVSLSVHQALLADQPPAGVRIVATDNSPAMVKGLQQALEGLDQSAISVEARCADLRDSDFQNCSFAILNFTLQFLELDARDELLQRLCAGLRPGGALVLAEKINFDDPAEQERLTHWHHDYKRLQGYSELEIARKRNALEAVLITETEARHRARLQAAGFAQVTRWFQCFGFCAWVAEKA